MLGSSALSCVLRDQLSALAACLPGIREGEDKAIHDARVATRRLRETLALAHTNLESEELQDILELIHRAGRALGDARDPDVAQRLLTDIENRLPAAAPIVVKMRSEAVRAQEVARRRLIKTVETLGLSAVPRRVIRMQRRRFLTARLGQSGWREALRDHIASRTAGVRHSMEHASGVYFPNRSHVLRLAIKKLRYALELADATGDWQSPRAIHRLKKAQDVLGKAHDRQVVIERLKELQQPDTGADRAAIDALLAFLESDIRALYDRYLSMRSDVTAICDACDRFARRRRRASALLAAGIALPTFILLRRRSSVGAHHAESRSENLQVHVRLS
jgi:CHAD domain-containing protein